jgi:hypothetical protein
MLRMLAIAATFADIYRNADAHCIRVTVLN